jgi:hypothetical protein
MVFSSDSGLRQFKDFSLGSFPYIQLLTYDPSFHSWISHHNNGLSHMDIYIYIAHMGIIKLSSFFLSQNITECLYSVVQGMHHSFHPTVT